MTDTQAVAGRNPLARRRALRRELAVRGAVSVNELSQMLGASAATVRRDLEALSREGVLERSYGGAAVRSTRPAEEALAVREQRHVEEKAAIARTALGLVAPGNTLFLNDGSTVMALARELAAAEIELFVVTSAVNIAHVLIANPRITVCLLGGFVRSTSLATGGQFAESMIDQFNADLALLSCDAFGAGQGMSFMHADDAAVARRMAGRAQRTVAMAIHPKFKATARIAALPLERVDVLVTDRMPTEVRQNLAGQRLQIVEARRSAGRGPAPWLIFRRAPRQRRSGSPPCRSGRARRASCPAPAAAPTRTSRSRPATGGSSPRVGVDLPHHFLTRDNEARSYRLAAEAGVAPALIHSGYGILSPISSRGARCATTSRPPMPTCC